MKRGFTLIELVFVIIIIGVLSAILAPRFDRPSITEATHQLVSHIRYTQHLAMMDDKFSPTTQFWHRERWHILFDTDTTIYTVASNRDRANDLNSTDIARDPSDPSKFLTADTDIVGIDNTNDKQELNLKEKYGIETLRLSGSCANGNNSVISFDYLGRPIVGDVLTDILAYQGTLIRTACVITLRAGDEVNNITIEPETGYVHTL
jgi:prepilin-type N-terminal cleavage/methylation domain-containing protein